MVRHDDCMWLALLLADRTLQSEEESRERERAMNDSLKGALKGAACGRF